MATGDPDLAPVHHIELQEGQPPRDFALTDAAAEALERSDLVTAQRLARGSWQVALTRKRVRVGVAVIGGTTLWIRPKLPVRRILFLLGYAQDPGWRDELVRMAEATDPDGAELGLVSALAQIFVDGAEKALEQGPRHGYVDAEASSTVLRGRVNDQDQRRRHYGMPVPLLVRFDDFTLDVPENQILKGAAERLLHAPGVAAPLRARLLRLCHRTLAGVSSPEGAAQLPIWQPTRLNTRYHDVLPLAEVILRGSSLDHAPGDVPLNGFLVNMEKVYEDFLAAALTEALRAYGGWCASQRPHHLDSGRAMRFVPDLVWHVGDTARAVVDAKYKARKEADRRTGIGVPREDIYQMLAYCGRLGAIDGHLVYAQGEATPDMYEIEQPLMHIHVHTLDLETGPRDLLAQVEGLAQRIAGFRGVGVGR